VHLDLGLLRRGPAGGRSRKHLNEHFDGVVLVHGIQFDKLHFNLHFDDFHVYVYGFHLNDFFVFSYLSRRWLANSLKREPAPGVENALYLHRWL
jgi:hypothetical protein